MALDAYTLEEYSNEGFGTRTGLTPSGTKNNNTMKHLSFTLITAGIMAATASATIISYNTTGTALNCNAVVGCTQNTATSVTLGGLTLTYSTASGTNVAAPSFISFGNIASTGTGTNVNLAGLQLVLNINSTPSGGPTTSGNIQVGALSGLLSTSNSSASIAWATNNTTTSFGTLPGATIGGQIYQVANSPLSLQAPTVGNPVGQTSIQGAVADVSATPEPTTMVMLGTGLAGVGLLRRRQRVGPVA